MSQSTFTRCPECGTVFRVTEQHLKIAHGKVRCGACLNVFVATNYLVKPKQPVAGLNTKASSDRQDSATRESEVNPQQATEAHSEHLVEQPAEAPEQEGSQLDSEWPDENAAASLAATSDESPTEQSDTIIDEPSSERKNTEEPNPAQTMSPFINESPFDAPEPGDWFTDDEADNADNDVTQNSLDETFEDKELELGVEAIDDNFGALTEDIDQTEHTNSFENESSIDLPVREQTDISQHELNVEVNTANEIDQHQRSKSTQAKSLENDFEDDFASFFEDDFAIDDHESGDTTQENVPHVEHKGGTTTGELASDADISRQDTEWNVSDDEQPMPTEAEAKPAKTPSASEFSRGPRDNEAQLDDDSSFEEEFSIDRLNQSLTSDTLEPDPLDEFDDIVEQKSHKWKWLSGIGVGLLIFIWGITTLWSERQTLAWDDTWGGLVHTMCTIAPCELKERRNIGAIELLQRDIRPADDNPDITEFNLYIRNNADFDQPYPIVEIAFTDTRGDVVSREVHTPEEYLSEATRNTKMPTGQKTLILIRAKQAYANAFGFEFDFK